MTALNQTVIAMPVVHRDPEFGAVGRRLNRLVEENRQLLEIAMQVQLRLIRLVANAPQMLIKPSAVHSAMMTTGLGTRPAMVGGVRKIPLTMVMPTISAIPPVNPMTRRRSCATAGAGAINEEFVRFCGSSSRANVAAITGPCPIHTGV